MDIQCPACSAQFNSPVDITGKMVQCGNCKEKFTVNSKTVISSQSQADQKNDDFLKSLQRVESKAVAVAPMNQPTFQQAMYQNMEGMSAADVMPLSPKSLIAIGVGIIAMLLGIVVFVVAGGPNGNMQDLSTDKRWVIAGFLAVLGSALVIFGNEKSRKKGVLLALLFALPLLAMPMIYPQQSKVAYHSADYSEKRTSDSDFEDLPDLPEPEAEVVDIEAFKKMISWDKVDQLMRREIAAGMSIDQAKSSVYAVYVLGMEAKHKYNVRDFLMQRSAATEASVVYERGQGNWLFLGKGMQVPLERLAEQCLQIGRVDEIFPDLRVIQVSVDPKKLVTADSDALTDPSSDEFYFVNYSELSSIDPKRVENAIKRLITAEPRMQRRLIRDKLLSLAKADPTNISLLEQIGKALQIWSIEDDSSDRLLLDSLLPNIPNLADVPESIIEFGVIRQNPSIVPAVLSAWEKKPLKQEANLIALGAVAEDFIIKHLAGLDVGLKQSAVRILTQIGTSKSLPGLNALKEISSDDFKKLIESAETAIKARS